MIYGKLLVPASYSGWLRNPAPPWMVEPLETMGFCPPIVQDFATIHCIKCPQEMKSQLQSM